jgi:hypothetical protein
LTYRKSRPKKDAIGAVSGEDKMRFQVCAAICAALMAFDAPALSQAQTQSNVKIGELRCNISVGAGLLITSEHALFCHFTTARGNVEDYHGTITKFGLDIGKVYGGVLAWAVFAPIAGARANALAGDYIGVGASATVGAGIGANALIGGSDRTITLQPFSIETQTGLDLSAGISALTLRAG